MGIKNKIKDKVLDIIERMYPNNLEINDNIEPEPERDRYGLTKEDWIGREDDESFSEMLRETYDPDYDYELEEYIKNYKALNDVRDDNKLEILTFIRDLEKFKVEMLDDLLDNKLQEKVKTGLIFSSGYVFKDFDFKTDDFKTNITDEQFKKIYEKEVEYKDNFINFKAYNKDGEEIFDRNTYKNSNEYERMNNFKEVKDLFQKYIDDDMFYFSSKSNYNTWERFVENEDVIVTYENKKTGELISDYSKENYSNLVFERKKDSIVKEQIDEVKGIVEYCTDEKTGVTNAEKFNKLRDIYAKDVRILTRQVEKLEKENQKDKNISKEKEIEVEKNNDKEMEL
jgi:hypothetical protein